MEKSAIHGSAVQRSQRSPIGIRQDRLAAKLIANAAKSRSNFVQRLIPADSLPDRRGLYRLCGDSRPRLSMRSEAPPFSRRTLGPNPSHGIQNASRRVHAIQILGHFRTQKSPRHRMLRIALNFRSPPILNRDQHSTSIRTVVRTRGMDDLFRHGTIIECPSTRVSSASEKKALSGSPFARRA